MKVTYNYLWNELMAERDFHFNTKKERSVGRLAGNAVYVAEKQEADYLSKLDK